MAGGQDTIEVEPMEGGSRVSIPVTSIAQSKLVHLSTGSYRLIVETTAGVKYTSAETWPSETEAEQQKAWIERMTAE